MTDERLAPETPAMYRARTRAFPQPQLDATAIPHDLLVQIKAVALERSRVDYARHRDQLVLALQKHLKSGLAPEVFFQGLKT